MPLSPEARRAAEALRDWEGAGEVSADEIAASVARIIDETLALPELLAVVDAAETVLPDAHSIEAMRHEPEDCFSGALIRIHDALAAYRAKTRDEGQGDE